jgi:hypothetical protein
MAELANLAQVHQARVLSIFSTSSRYVVIRSVILLWNIAIYKKNKIANKIPINDGFTIDLLENESSVFVF